MSDTVGDFILQRLSDWDIRRLYGFPGDGINGIYGALNRAEDRFAYIQSRHEEMAAFMACAHAKFTGQVGAGALAATDEVIKVADQLGAGVAKALLGKAVLPDELPFVTGSIGLLGTEPSWDLMSNCDTLLMVGSRHG